MSTQPLDYVNWRWTGIMTGAILAVLLSYCAIVGLPLSSLMLRGVAIFMIALTTSLAMGVTARVSFDLGVLVLTPAILLSAAAGAVSSSMQAPALVRDAAIAAVLLACLALALRALPSVISWWADREETGYESSPAAAREAAVVSD